MRPALVVLVAAFLAAGSGVAAPETVSDAFEIAAAPVPAGRLDKLVFAELARLKVHPVLCSDAVFVRRAYLDVTGTLPTAKEARDFIQDPDTKNKRRLLIDRLLDRPEFADYWAMRWGDILRIKAEFPVNLWPNAAQAYHRWVRASIAENKPYDKFVRELLTSSGSNFRVGPVNFFRAVQNRTPESIATAVALVFMGTRVASWPADKLAGMAAFYSQVGYKPTSEWKEEDVFWDPLGASRTPGNTAPGRDAIARAKPAPTAAAAPAPPQPPAVSAPHAAGISQRQESQVAAGPGSAGSLRRMVDHAQEPLVYAGDRKPGLVLDHGPRHHPRAGRYPAGQPAKQSRAAGLPGKGVGPRALRFEGPITG